MEYSNEVPNRSCARLAYRSFRIRNGFGSGRRDKRPASAATRAGIRTRQSFSPASGAAACKRRCSTLGARARKRRCTSSGIGAVARKRRRSATATRARTNAGQRFTSPARAAAYRHSVCPSSADFGTPFDIR